MLGKGVTDVPPRKRLMGLPPWSVLGAAIVEGRSLEEALSSGVELYFEVGAAASQLPGVIREVVEDLASVHWVR